MADKEGISLLTIVMPVGFVVIFLIAGFLQWQGSLAVAQNANKVACTQEAKLCPDGSYVGRTGPDCEFAQCPVTNDAAGNWQIYADVANGFEFRYPQSFNTRYASLQQIPTAIVMAAQSQNIDSKGCYIPQAGTPTTSEMIMNGIKFCITESEDIGAGQLYKSYYFSTFRNEKYIILEFVVHTSNGCTAYAASPQQKECEDFIADYGNVVLKPIQMSVSSF